MAFAPAKEEIHLCRPFRKMAEQGEESLGIHPTLGRCPLTGKVPVAVLRNDGGLDNRRIMNWMTIEDQ